MNLFLFLFFILFHSASEPLAVDSASAASKGLCSEGVLACDVAPQYPGGMEAFYKEVSARVKMEKNINGKLEVFFYINCRGKLVSPKVRKSLGFTTDEKVIAVLKSMKEWTPGKLRGEGIDQSMILYMEAKNGVLVKGKERNKL